MSIRILLQTPAVAVRAHDDIGVVTMVRTQVELPRDRPGLEKFFAELIHAFDGLDRSRFALLVDGRAAVGRNDATFEAVQSECMGSLFGGYRKLVAVVATTAGRLQLARYTSSAGGVDTEVFADLDDAFAYAALPGTAKHG
ncbi:MAG: hypothetical protein ACRBN8_32685 [Nannocystales bacterium]